MYLFCFSSLIRTYQQFRQRGLIHRLHAWQRIIWLQLIIYIVARNESPRVYIHCVENVYYTNYNQYLRKLFLYARFYSWWKLNNNVQYDIEDKGLRCAYLHSELIALRNKMYFNATLVSTVNSYTFNFGINILIFIINGIPLYARN